MWEPGDYVAKTTGNHNLDCHYVLFFISAGVCERADLMTLDSPPFTFKYKEQEKHGDICCDSLRANADVASAVSTVM